MIYYVNGKFENDHNAKVSVLDIGLLRGYGVFDFVVTYRGRPFLIDEHINRLFNSAKLIGLKIGKTKTQIKRIILKTLQKNADKTEKTIRIVVTGGVGENSLEPSFEPTIVAIVQPKHNYPDKNYMKGVKVVTYNYTRPMALAKSLDYSIAIKALKSARKNNAIEALYINKKNNTISEATTSNFFIVKNNKIYTPSDNVLNGITRNIIIKLLTDVNPVYEKGISVSELLSSDEAFITASNKEIMPVVKIDNKKVGNGKVGIVTKEVIRIFRKFIDKGIW